MTFILDVNEIQSEVIRLNRELERTVDKIAQLLKENVIKKRAFKEAYAKKYLELRGQINEGKKIIDEEAKQRAFLETIDLYEESELSEALIEAFKLIIKQKELEIESFRSILSYEGRTYEKANIG